MSLGDRLSSDQLGGGIAPPRAEKGWSSVESKSESRYTPKRSIV